MCPDAVSHLDKQGVLAIGRVSGQCPNGVTLPFAPSGESCANPPPRYPAKPGPPPRLQVSLLAGSHASRSAAYAAPDEHTNADLQSWAASTNAVLATHRPLSANRCQGQAAAPSPRSAASLDREHDGRSRPESGRLARARSQANNRAEYHLFFKGVDPRGTPLNTFTYSHFRSIRIVGGNAEQMPYAAHSANGNSYALRQKVTFAANVATIIELEDDGKETEGKWGTQYQYFLAGNQIMWVEPDLRAAIWQCGARAGNQVSITKREIKEGRTKRVQWEVQRVIEQAPRNTGGNSPAKPGPTQAAPAESQPSADPFERFSDKPRPKPEAPLEADQLDIPTIEGEQLRALKAAIRIALHAQAYAKQVGLPIMFNAGDVRAMATTMAISAREVRR